MSDASDSVVIKAPARLHLGLVKISRKPSYIAVGVSLEEPYCELEVKRSSAFRVYGQDIARIKTAIRDVCAYTGSPLEFSARLAAPLPAHSGLGSGTRHALCAVKAVCLLENKKIPAVKLAEITGRGTRSMMGTALFAKGGLAVDIAGEVSRFPAPRSWRVVLIQPDISKSGHAFTHGPNETGMMRKAPACSASEARLLIDSVTSEMIPAIKENDFKTFEKSLQRLQASAIKLFGSFQDGSAGSKSGREILRYLRRIGVRAVGQTSWGPTLFAILPSLSKAESLAERLTGLRCVKSATVTRISNRGFRARRVSNL
ncbi:hypothetical protein MNBD_NITROSPINAE04-258 [hydrothermal vent metagenome]|uniref:Uncharacterized protein n=1 Tax=hydrothermal vent metagenome TaxID=652676 RepID=A0A3B1BTA5_9ZZZZ